MESGFLPKTVAFLVRVVLLHLAVVPTALEQRDVLFGGVLSLVLVLHKDPLPDKLRPRIFVLVVGGVLGLGPRLGLRRLGERAKDGG
eukprot:COSAG05_NODE_10626_length_555_cov_0.427632_1_plen_86_part_10